MSGSDLRQRLAAILVADVAKYSRLMAADERGTVAALDAGRSVFRSHIEANRGRIIDMAGDSILAVFETATGAVTASLAIQKQLDTLTAGWPEDRRMRFRIGVHLGDVFEKSDGTIYGDGVNIAARLESLAEAGGVAISESVRVAVRGKVAAVFEDQGEHPVKNIIEPVRVFWARTGDAAAISNVTTKRPSIAVLPFDVLSDDSRLGFLADGLVEDVIALLARVPGFLVIARSSSFLFRGPKVPLVSAARQLGVRYVVAGSVRAIGDHRRVSTQLSDAETGQVLWSSRFDVGRHETEDLQETIARAVIAELEPALTRAEIAVVRRQRPENVDAWGCYRQALGALSLKGWSEDALHEATDHFRRAVTVDPTFALA